MVLASSIIVMFISFILSVFCGVVFIPLLRKFKASQSLSVYLERAHSSKVGTPTMGGIIFIFPTLFVMLLLIVFNKVTLTYNLIILIFTFFSYALIGFIDDFLIILRHNNKGLSINQKFFLQLVVSVIFFFLFMKGGNEPIFWIHTLGIKCNIGFFYGIVILFILVASSNAVNISDGLDGLCGGLSVIAFISISIISWNTEWLDGYQGVALFGFILVGSILGFLMFNVSPAKVFMGDTGSLCLGATLGAICILIRHELLLIVVGFVFVIETITCILQIVYFKLFHKRLFPIAPIHHTFERFYSEKGVVHIFWLVGVLGGIVSIIIGVFM